MVTIDDEKVTEMVQNLVTEESHDATLGRIAAEDLRAVFMKLCGRLRTKMETLDRQAMEIAMVAMEV